TWGWTGLLLQVGQGAGPSPTHVGMDRSLLVTVGVCHTEPHARGNGPLVGRQARGDRRRAAHTCGWIAREEGSGSGVRSRLRHVGMDRRLLVTVGVCHTEPHARGDGPLVGRQPRGNRRRAPRTWGWTAKEEGNGSGWWPSPTHVGMDRSLLVTVGVCHTEP